MSKKLTKTSQEQPVPLTNRQSTQFKISLEEKLYNNYKFDSLINQNHTKKFQNFLDKLLGKTWNDVEKLYSRKNDKHDKHDKKEQIIHFGEQANKLRLHGVIRGEYFVLLCIDLCHERNKS